MHENTANGLPHPMSPPGLLALVLVIVATLFGSLVMTLPSLGLGAGIVSKWLTTWAILLLLALPAAWLAVVGMRRLKRRRNRQNNRSRFPRLA